MMPQDSLKIKQTPTNTATVVEVFADDFIGATNNLQTKNLQKISRAMLHGIHLIFPPNEIKEHPEGIR